MSTLFSTLEAMHIAKRTKKEPHSIAAQLPFDYSPINLRFLSQPKIRSGFLPYTV